MGPEGWRPRRVGPEVWRPRRVEAPKGGPRRAVAPKGGGPNLEKVGPPRVGSRTVGAQNFALFFPLPPNVFDYFSLSFGLFRGILVVFEVPVCSNVHVWSSRAVVCEPRRPGLVGPPGFHTTTREPKRAHRKRPTLANPVLAILI